MTNRRTLSRYLRVPFFFAMAVGFISSLFLSEIARADLKPNEKEAIREFLMLYQKHKTAKSLIDELKPQLPPAYFEFLKARAAELGDRPLAKMSMRDASTILIQNENVLVPFKVVSLRGQTFQINNKTLDFSATDSIEERWSKILATLPAAQRSGAMMRLAFPEAYADGSALKIAGGSVGTAGISAGLVAAGPIGWGIALASAVGGYVMWNMGQCKEYFEYSLKCETERDLLNRKLADKSAKKFNEKLKSEHPRPQCKDKKEFLDDDAYRAVMNFLSEVVPEDNDTLSHLASFCQGSGKEHLSKCIPELILKAHYLCADVSRLERRLPTWAKEEPKKDKSGVQVKPSNRVQQ